MAHDDRRRGSAALPALYAQIAAPKGSAYLGFEYNTDDHMVYSAWMREAMDGHFFFDNRFTTDPQPGLTVHLYFWIFGLVAKIVGIPFASNLARLAFTGLFVPLLYRLVRRVSGSVFTTRLAVTVTIWGAGSAFSSGTTSDRLSCAPTASASDRCFRGGCRSMSGSLKLSCCLLC